MIITPARKINNGLDLGSLFKIKRTINIDKFYPGRFPPESGYPHLIVNACPTDPFDLSLDLFLSGEWCNYLIDTLKMVGEQISLHLVIDKTKIDFIRNAALHLPRINIYPVEAIYPQDNRQALLRLVNLPAEQTKIITLAQLFSRQIIALSFWSYPKRVWRQLVMDLPPLTFEELWKTAAEKEADFSLSGCRIIIGGLFTGKELKSFSELITSACHPVVIIPSGEKRDFFPHFYRRFIEPDIYTTNTYGEERSCINCGWCDDICPVRIPVKRIYVSICKNRLDEAIRFGLYDCIECGLCTYQCPSKIMLLEFIMEGKRKK